MTFCLGINVDAGLVALADTRIVKGDEQLNRGKLEIIDYHGDPIFIMTSGLRSVRDKSLIYLRERLQAAKPPLERLYQVANLFGTCLRQVRDEDGAALLQDGLQFNTHAIIGGRLSKDERPILFYVYPAGNWIESSHDSPYFIIGRTSYGKPILDRLLRYGSPLSMAVKLGYLAFDATRASVIDVDFPIEILVYDARAKRFRTHGFTEQELLATGQWWTECLTEALKNMPAAWAEPLFVESSNASRQ